MIDIGDGNEVPVGKIIYEGEEGFGDPPLVDKLNERILHLEKKVAQGFKDDIKHLTRIAELAEIGNKYKAENEQFKASARGMKKNIKGLEKKLYREPQDVSGFADKINAQAKRIKELEEENQKLKQILGKYQFSEGHGGRSYCVCCDSSVYYGCRDDCEIAEVLK